MSIFITIEQNERNITSKILQVGKKEKEPWFLASQVIHSVIDQN